MRKIPVTMFRALIAVLLLAAAPSVWASDQALWEHSTLNEVLKRGELRVGLEAGYMPFEMRDKNGRIIGFDVDLARLMARYLGVKLTLVNTQWDGIIPALLTGKFDLLMGGMSMTPERNLQVNFVDPYVTIGQTVLIRKDLIGKITSYDQLNDPKYTIATKLGTTGDIAARKYLANAKIKAFETEAEATLEVRSGRADAFVYDLPYNAVYVARYPGQVGILRQTFTEEPLAWAVRKGDPDFINWLDNFLRYIKADGSYDALYHKWFEGTAWLHNVSE
ncbi:transporter substrate-binding domain-containing protein [Solimonas marina]|uniref:Transporter substrate-binding domain-containing protein n=1 Tax=Solimonas marina TaxID=2714601 RepID=A0A970BB43_9GAMM|nr:transporter substrate-binding domain-containing protein [Solimonas marina]NKF24006.1 transporter substrate-binding domain-containing protein [Solimonas marina]